MSEQNQYKLEYKLLYSLIVAGKGAKFAEAVMARFLHRDSGLPGLMAPFELVRGRIKYNELGPALRAARSGNYRKLERAFKAIVEANLDLRLCTPQDLEKVPGIGPKTSRFFILWTRPGAQYAALDTHVLKWLAYLKIPDVPKSTPPKNHYQYFEDLFLVEAKKRGLTPGELDESIWRWCSENHNKRLDYSKAESWPEELR